MCKIENALKKLGINIGRLEPPPSHHYKERLLRKMRNGSKDDDSILLNDLLDSQRVNSAKIVDIYHEKGLEPYAIVEVEMGDGSRREGMVWGINSHTIPEEDLISKINPPELWDPTEEGSWFD